MLITQQNKDTRKTIIYFYQLFLAALTIFNQGYIKIYQ